LNKTLKCPCYGTTLSKLVHPVVLTILAIKDVHGYQIAELAAKTPLLAGSRPDTAGIYHLLRTMEKSGYVKVMRQISEKGPARKVYHLTASGRVCLQTWLETLSRYHKALGSFLKTAGRVHVKGEAKDKRKRAQP